VLAVPTTYAGSEMTPIWGLTGADGKRTGRSPRVLPRTVVYDPALTVPLPADVTAASGMNALAHALEALYAPDVTPELAAVAEEALRALASGLPGAVARGEDLDARAEVLYGAWLAGWALGGTTMGLHHKLAHVLGGTYRLPHAAVHSALLPQVAAFTAPAAAGAFARAAGALGEHDPARVPPALFGLAVRLSAPTSLARLGLRHEAIPAVAREVATSAVRHPRPVTENALRALLEAAYEGRDLRTVLGAGRRSTMRQTTPDTEALDRERERIRDAYLRRDDGRPASSARGLHHTALISSNVERTIGFYQGVLEFPLTELIENRDYPGSSHFFFDIGNENLLAFFDFPGLDLGPYAEVLGGVHHVAISVDSEQWHRLVERLTQAGIEYEIHSQVSVYFRDPDGARIELISDPLGEMYGTRVL
jgi:catechol 2,3-dioxygenase-like lactoylglutathione lyase family enzyme